VPFATIAQQPIGAALAPPVHRRHTKAAPTQVGDDLEVFLDVLAAALEQADRAPPGSPGWSPAREAQIYSANTLKQARCGPARHRVLRKCHQIHASLRQLRRDALYSRP